MSEHTLFVTEWARAVQADIDRLGAGPRNCETEITALRVAVEDVREWLASRGVAPEVQQRLEAVLEMDTTAMTCRRCGLPVKETEYGFGHDCPPRYFGHRARPAPQGAADTVRETSARRPLPPRPSRASGAG